MPATAPFPSVPVLRRTHTTLLRRQRGESGTKPPTVEEIVNFMVRARATGRQIAAAESRDAIQGLIDYWYGILMLGDRKGVGELGSLNLDEFAGSSTETPEADSASESQARARAELDAKVQAFDAQLPAENRPLLRRLLLRLFTLSVARNNVELIHLPKTDEFLSDPAADKLAAAMLAAGLLKTEATDSGSEGAYVLADPGLLKAWPAFETIVDERLSLRDMTAGWEKSGKSPSALLESGSLLDFAADYVNLKPVEAVFLSESRKAALLNSKRKFRLMIGAIAVLMALVVVLVWQMMALWEQTANANAARITAEANRLAAETAEKRATSSADDVKKQRDIAIVAVEAEKKANLAAAAAREAEKKAVISKAASDEAEARQRERLLRDQLDATNQAAAEMRAIVEDARRTIGTVKNLRGALVTRLSKKELNSFDDTIAKLQTSLKLAETTAATASALDYSTGSATQVVQNVTKDPRPRLVKVLEGHRQPITAIAFAKDGKLATAGEDNLVRVWTPKGASFTEPITGSSQEGVNCLAFSPAENGRWLAIGSQGSTVRLRDFTNNTSSAYEGHSGPITSVSFSNDGSKVLSASADKTIQIWNPHNSQPIQKFKPTDSAANSATFNSDSTRVLGALEGNEAMVWTVGSDADPLRLPRAGPVKRALFNIQGDRIVTASLDKTVAVWLPSATSSSNPPLVWSEALSGPVFQAVFSPGGDQVACASGDRTAKIWDARTGRQLRDLQGHQKTVNQVVYHPRGKILLTGSADATAKLWYEGELQARYTLEGHLGPLTAVAFNDVGTQIATGSQDGTVRLYDFQEEIDKTPPTEEATGWSLYGWLDTNSKGTTPRLRAQSFAPETGARDAIPTVPTEPSEEPFVAKAEAIMNVRDEIKAGPDNRWDQGKPIDLLRKGDRVKIVEVLWDKEMVMQPKAVWIKFKKL
jgi:WD40 repeat protein